MNPLQSLESGWKIKTQAGSKDDRGYHAGGQKISEETRTLGRRR